MKKLFTIFAALTLAFSAFADKIYFQTTSACDWSLDEAKIGAVFRTGMTDADYGLFTEFFTAVDGVAGLYEAEIPANGEPWVSVQFLRYNPATTATKPFWGDFWNGTDVEAWDASKNMFTATSWGGGQLTTTGTWSAYVPTSAAETEAQEVQIFSRSKTVTVLLDGAASLVVYNMAGATIVETQIEDFFTFNVSEGGIYIVSINGKATKIYVR